MSKNPYNWIEKSLTTIHRANWYRSVQTIESLPGSRVKLDGRLLINFASNDYLGLAGDDRLIEAAIEATREFGTGSSGSRLLSGHRQLHRDLELAIAQLKQTEDALVFSSGYLANLGTISAIVGSRDLILSDEYNHSSLKNGAKLSDAETIAYRHLDFRDLEDKLNLNRHKYRRCAIVSDSVFSMNGDICQVKELIELAEKFNCMAIVDEAHATGVMGETGAGCVEYFGCSGKELIQIGTLSKALGSLGGYVAGSRLLIDFLRNRAPSWIYTTALSPADTAAAKRAIEIVKSEPQRRDRLWNNVKILKQKLINYPLLPSQSPIVCLGLSNPALALDLAEKLKSEGIFAPAIRPPTVPKSRIRFSIMATHQPEEIEQLATIIKRFYQTSKQEN